jgi:predicted transcriptional regulator
MGDLSDLERGQIVGACLARASVIKTATLLGVSRATVSKIMSACTNHGKINISKEEQWMKINTDRKKLTYTENESHNYCSTDDSRTKYSS